MMTTIIRKLQKKLERKSYRDSYVAEHVKRGIAYQIRALRDQRDWNQGKFAKKLGKPQSVVSRLEDPDYGNVTVQTLLEIASVYDVALRIQFVDFEKFVSETRQLSNVSMYVESFDPSLFRDERVDLSIAVNDDDAPSMTFSVHSAIDVDRNVIGGVSNSLGEFRV